MVGFLIIIIIIEHARIHHINITVPFYYYIFSFRFITVLSSRYHFHNNNHLFLFAAFHDGKDEKDQNKLIIMWDQARKGLLEVQKYTKLDPKKVVNRISIG